MSLEMGFLKWFSKNRIPIWPMVKDGGKVINSP